LTGVTIEHVLFFLWGTGGNGKTVVTNTLLGIWNDLATVAPLGLLTEHKNERHPTELAALRGVRLVIAQETEQGSRWDEVKLKALTGGDPIKARFMRQDEFVFTPRFKLIISGNHKPSLRNVDEAIRRRIHLVPFVVTIPPEKRDRQFAEKLRPEWPGILQWAVDGCMEWQRIGGLAPPPAVTAATEEYLTAEDSFARWVDECCEVGEWLFGVGNRLWGSWAAWADRGRERIGTRKGFAQAMIAHGYKDGRNAERIRGYEGIDLRGESNDGISEDEIAF
jgi:P4 family phage/plasmid primase-like protien